MRGERPLCSISSCKTGLISGPTPPQMWRVVPRNRGIQCPRRSLKRTRRVSSALRRRVKVATDGSLCMTHRAEEKVVRRASSRYSRPGGLFYSRINVRGTLFGIASCLIVKMRRRSICSSASVAPLHHVALAQGGGGGGRRVGYLRVTMEFQDLGPSSNFGTRATSQVVAGKRILNPRPAMG